MGHMQQYSPRCDSAEHSVPVWFIEFLSKTFEINYCIMFKMKVDNQTTHEPPHEKTNNLHMRKQRRRVTAKLITPLFSLHR